MNDTPSALRLLLVEDNPPEALLLRHMLRSQGCYQVTEAGALRDAKAALGEQAFDVVLLDLTLPDSEGLATVDALLAADPALPILVLTGVDDDAVAVAAVRRGAQDYLVKGHADAPLVVRAIRYAIERKRAEEALRRAHDGLEQKVRERTAELQQANQTLRMISECNQILVRATDERELILRICQIIVDLGGYCMAWVGYAQDDAGKTVTPMAAVGFEEGYLERAAITWADTEFGRGPTGTCIRTGQVCVGTDFLTDPALAPWREQALARGYRSSVALPLASGGKTFGSLTIYAREPETFDPGDTALLREMADDLAFGIFAVRAQRERDHARWVADQRAVQLRALATELTQAEHKERRRLAQFLHDHLQQLLVGAKLNAGVLRAKVKVAGLERVMEQLVTALDEAIKASRSLTAELSPPVLHEKGLAAGLEWLARQSHERHGLTVDVRADEAAEPASEQIRAFLFDAVRELLFNVVKHAGIDRAEVRLSCGEDGGVVVAVADQGAGFDLAAFEARDDATGGFGLFSLRERLAFLGGSLQLDAAPGRGSRITLRVPGRGSPAASEPAAVTGVAAPAPASARAHLPAASPGRIRVLLADDHPVMRQGLARVLLEHPDLEVVGEAGDGHAALALARQLQPDVVLMDVTMPGLSGFDATRFITAELPRTRVIGLSMHAEADMAEGMRRAGAVAYLTKGGPTEQIIAAIRACRPTVDGPSPARA